MWVGISLVVYVVRMFRCGLVRKCLDLGYLVGEETLRYREDAARFGLFAGGFAGMYLVMWCWLCYVMVLSGGEEGVEMVEKGVEKGVDVVVEWSARESFTFEFAAFIAGGVVGLFIFFFKLKYCCVFLLYFFVKFV